MEEFLIERYGIDINSFLGKKSEGFRVCDLVSLLREKGTEKNVMNNLHNSPLNKEQALIYLNNITSQLIMEGENIKESMA